jgi:hypothetical protein
MASTHLRAGEGSLALFVSSVGRLRKGDRLSAPGEAEAASGAGLIVDGGMTSTYRQ